MKISNIAFGDVLQQGLMSAVLLLICLDILVVIMALILFPFLWKD